MLLNYLWKWSAVAVFVFSVVVLAGCGSEDLKELPPPSSHSCETTNDFPAVVKVLGSGLCTGTIVSPRAVLTAAHCVAKRSRTVVVTPSGNAIAQKAIKFGKGTVGDKNDIALLIFDEEIADSAKGEVIRIGGKVAKGDPIQVVGYGCSKKGSGKKVAGKNVIYRISDYIEIVAPRSAMHLHRVHGPSNRAVTCSGDSGGPALKQFSDGWRVVGVTHAGGEEAGHIYSEYVNLTRADNRKFLLSVSRHFNLGIEE